MKRVWTFSLFLFACSSNPKSPANESTPSVFVECNPTTTNCDMLIREVADCDDFIVVDNERVSFNTYRKEVVCQ